MRYENIEIEVVLFENDDILTLSVQKDDSNSEGYSWGEMWQKFGK